MALAALAPILGGLIAPSALTAMGISMPTMLASALGSGLLGWAASGNPITGLEDAAGGVLGSGLGGLLGGGSAATQAATQAGTGVGSGAADALTPDVAGAITNAAIPQSTVLTNTAAANALTPDAANPLSGVMNYATAHPYMTGLGGLAALGALGVGQPKTPGQQTYTSPGLTPYKTQTYVAPPAGFQPGISPEPYYLSNPGGYAEGGPVVANPYQTSAPGMVDLQLGLNPQQIVQRQLMQQTLGPAERYAGGGGIPQLPKPQMSVDSRGMSMLQREAMRSAMPYPHPARTMSAPKMAMPHAASASIGKNPLGMAMGGGVPGGLPGGMGGMGGMPGMQVPDVAGDGSSDSIPATIDGQQPALLSSGEHVIPADAVSALGNGSTDAGSKQLHAMTNRIRIAKTGSAKMPSRINPRKIMLV